MVRVVIVKEGSTTLHVATSYDHVTCATTTLCGYTGMAVGTFTGPDYAEVIADFEQLRACPRCAARSRTENRRTS